MAILAFKEKTDWFNSFLHLKSFFYSIKGACVFEGSLVQVQSSSFTAVQTGVIFPAVFWGNVTFFVLLAVRALLFYKPSSLLSLQRVPKALSHCLTYYVSLNVTFYGSHYWSDSSRCEPLYSRVFIYTHLCLPTPFWRSHPPRTTSKPSRSALPILHTWQNERMLMKQ